MFVYFLQERNKYRRVELCDCICWNSFKDGWPNIFIDNVQGIAGRDSECLYVDHVTHADY